MVIKDIMVPFFGIDRTTFTAASNLASTDPAMFTASERSRVVTLRKMTLRSK